MSQLFSEMIFFRQTPPLLFATPESLIFLMIFPCQIYFYTIRSMMFLKVLNKANTLNKLPIKQITQT